MVRLLNILLDDDSISCDYIPENSNDIGKVTVNVTTREVTNIAFSKYEYGKKCTSLTSVQSYLNYWIKDNLFLKKQS